MKVFCASGHLPNLLVLRVRSGDWSPTVRGEEEEEEEEEEERREGECCSPDPSPSLRSTKERPGALPPAPPKYNNNNY